MKKTIKIILYGIAGIILLLIGVIIVGLPSALAEHTANNKYLLLYIPHILGLLYLLGWVIYDLINLLKSK